MEFDIPLPLMGAQWPAQVSAEPTRREWTNQESWLLTPDSLETFLRWESESRVTIQDSRVRSQLKSPSENLENFEHFLLIYLVNEALKCWKWSSYSKRYLNMVKVVNKVKDELEKLPHFTLSYGIKIGSDRESWLELESSNLGQGRESESEYWNKVTCPFPNVLKVWMVLNNVGSNPIRILRQNHFINLEICTKGYNIISLLFDLVRFTIFKFWDSF